MRRISWVGIVLVMLGCSGSSNDEPQQVATTPAPEGPSEPPEPVEPPAEVPEGVDEAALPVAEAPPAGLDPAFDAAQPTRGGLFAPFEAVPQALQLAVQLREYPRTPGIAARRGQMVSSCRHLSAPGDDRDHALPCLDVGS